MSESSSSCEGEVDMAALTKAIAKIRTECPGLGVKKLVLRVQGARCRLPHLLFHFCSTRRRSLCPLAQFLCTESFPSSKIDTKMVRGAIISLSDSDGYPAPTSTAAAADPADLTTTAAAPSALVPAEPALVAAITKIKAQNPGIGVKKLVKLVQGAH